MKENNNRPNQPSPERAFKKTNFYFYNDRIVAFGIESFKSVWGNRERNTYWRSEKSILNNKELSNNLIKEEQSEELVLENEAQLLELYKDIPFTQSKKDSIKNLSNKSKLELAELYIVKYKNYNLGEAIINKYLSC